MASRRNDSRAMARKADNLTCRQGAAIASSSSSSSSSIGCSLQRTPYSTRQSLSSSYDFSDGLSRMSQASSKKFGSPVLRRSASPPASFSIRKHNNCAIGTNQTVLDDAAWMSERIQNLHKTGCIRHPSMSKLRDPSRPLSASNEDYEELSCSPSSRSFNQNSTSVQNQTAITYADEPLSAFRLSEVTLSEEDLLTDISSTCNSTPVSLQSGCMLDQTAADFYEGSSCSHNAERTHIDIRDHNLAAFSKNSPLNVRGDLLHRLEALQNRAELAAKASHTIKTDSNQDIPYFKDPWNGQVLHFSKVSLPSNHSGKAVSLRSNAAASPTYSTLETTSWPEESENSSDSTCWLKAMNEDVKTKPCMSHLIHSSSRIIRPEYYLPLSREEEPVHEPVASRLSSVKEGRKLDLKGENLSLRRSSLIVCQHRSEHTRRRKLLNSHKQINQATKSRKFLERSTDSISRSVMGQGVISVTGPLLCPTAARKACLTEGKATQSSLYAEFMVMEDPIEEAAGQKQKSLQSEIGSDGEASWISEENVEGFLRSQYFSVNQVDALDTSREISDTNECSSTITTFVNGKHSQTKDNEEFELHSVEQSFSISSNERDICSHDIPSQCIKQSMESSSMFDICIEGCLTFNNQTSSHCQVLEGGSLAHSRPPLPEFDGDQNLLTRPECQVCHSKEDKMGIEARNATLESQQVQSKHVIKPFQFERCIFDNLTTPMTTELTSLETTMSSPESHLIEHRHGPVVSEGHGKVSPSDGLSEKARSHSEHRNFTKIARSLSFSEKGKGELEPSSKQNTCNELSELKSTSFSHYWIRNSAYSLDISELLNNESKGSTKADEVSLSPKNFVEVVHGLNPQTTRCFIEQELSKEGTSLAHRIGVSAEDKTHGGTDATLLLPNESCMAASECGTSEVSATRLKFSQQSHQHQLDNSAGTLHKLQDDSTIESVKKDKNCWQQRNDSEQSEMYDKVVLQETLKKGKDACTRVLSQYKNELEQTEHKFSEELTLSENHISELSINCQNNNFMSEDTMKGNSKLTCSTSLQEGETESMKTTPSMLSVYKNPLWLDEDTADFENHHNFQDEEFLHFTYCSERSKGFLDSDKAKLSCSKRSEDKTWDTYEGMGAFISSFPNSPCCTNEGMSEAQDKLMGFPNCSDLDSLRDVTSKTKRKLKSSSEDVEDGHASVCRFQVCENCLTSKELITSELSGYDAKQKLSAYVQPDQDQLLVSTPETTLRSNITSHALSSTSSSVKVLSIADDNCNFSSSSSSPLLCCEERLHLKDISTTCTQVSSHGARKPDSLEKCSSEPVIWPGSISLTSNNNNVAIQNATFLARENELSYNTSSILSTREESLLLLKLSCQSDEPKAGEPVVKANHNSKRERSRQELCASIETPGVLSTQLACVVQRNDQSYQEYKRKHLNTVDHELSSVNATKEKESLNASNILLSDEMEVGEEVKRVTFVYSDSNEPPQKNVAATLPEVPLDLLSTWVLSLFSHATKGGGNLKKTEQKQPLIQEKSEGNEKDLNRIGKKVEVLEAEIDKFKRENKKLKNLMKSMIRKMKQFQKDFHGNRRRKISRGFMTCIYSVRVQRSKSKTLRKS